MKRYVFLITHLWDYIYSLVTCHIITNWHLSAFLGFSKNYYIKHPGICQPRLRRQLAILSLLHCTKKKKRDRKHCKTDNATCIWVVGLWVIIFFLPFLISNFFQWIHIVLINERKEPTIIPQQKDWGCSDGSGGGSITKTGQKQTQKTQEGSHSP